jgi:hypothetical protein
MKNFFAGPGKRKLGRSGANDRKIRERDFFAEKTGLILDSLKRTEE